MPTLKNSITIPRDVSTENNLDFEYLRRIGIRYIASVGGGLWTDYNEHDPGITTLEMLSYAITDLGNRMNLSMPDLLTGPDGSASISTQFYTAQQILPNRAVTALDYRKIFLDLEGVRNCWIVPYRQTIYANCELNELSYNKDAFPGTLPQYLTDFDLKGLNSLLVDFNVDEDDPNRAQLITDITQAIKDKYHANRNLCEDLAEIKEVEEQPISVCAKIEIADDADEDMVNAEVLFAIYSYFSPFLKFHSLKEMLARGYRMDEIFEGPLLENGFIDTQELSSSMLRSEIRLSDIINLIMDIPGVKNIREISIGNCGEANRAEDWMICIEKFKRPVLCDKSTFSYFKDLLPVFVNETRSETLFKELKLQAQADDDDASADRFPAIPEGEYLETGSYVTIQNDFPDTYGISPEGLASNVGTARKAQAKQLKAYLLFFDQVLATYFAYLKSAGDLLAVNSELRTTSFTQAVKGITGLSELVNNYPQNNDLELGEILFEGLINDEVRKNEILDQLLSRFAEQLGTYAFSLHRLYGTATGEMALYSKRQFLNEYITLSSERGMGFNYYHRYNPLDPSTVSAIWNTPDVTGTEKRIARLSGIKNYNRRNLAVNPFFEVTEPTPGTFKWKVKKNGQTILSSAISRASYDEASNDVYAAALALIETSEEEINAAFAAGIAPNMVIDNIQIKLSGSSNYYFNVVNPALPPSDPQFIIGKQLMYFADPADLQTSLLNVIKFMKYDFTGEGMFLVEHILLRPQSLTAGPDEFLDFCADNCADDCCGIDPYSFRISIVLPGFTPRFANMDFRAFMEKLIREELPAHVLAKICWVGTADGDVLPQEGNQLLKFEQFYLAWLKEKTSVLEPDPGVKLAELAAYILKLNTIYPEGKLHDCENDDYTGDIILDRSRIGTSN